MAEQSDIPNLDGLMELGNRDGVDIRPTLLRVTTDLYVAKDRHSTAEERHYTELALRLIDLVDAPTREIVAKRLSGYADAPAAVLQRLARDMPHAAESVAVKPPAELPEAVLPPRTETPRVATPKMTTPHVPTPQAAKPTHAPVAKAIPVIAAPPAPAYANAAEELSELFFNATASQRRLILLNIDYALWEPATPIAADLALEATRRLETNAFNHSTYAFAQELERSLAISRKQARRVIEDPSGEALVVVARTLAMPGPVLQRILLCLNPMIGRSVQRVYELVDLYDELEPRPALLMLALWRAAYREAPKTMQKPASPAVQPPSPRHAAVETRGAAPLPVTRPKIPWNEFETRKSDGT